MQTEIRVLNEDDIEASITITMPINEWVTLQKQLNSAYPSWKLSAAITDLLYRFRARITGVKTED